MFPVWSFTYARVNVFFSYSPCTSWELLQPEKISSSAGSSADQLLGGVTGYRGLKSLSDLTWLGRKSQLILYILCPIQALLSIHQDVAENYWRWRVAVFYTAKENHGEDISLSITDFNKSTLSHSFARCKNVAHKTRLKKLPSIYKGVEKRYIKGKKNKLHIILSVRQMHFKFSHLEKYLFVKQTGCKGFPVFLASRVKGLQNISF